VAMSFTMKNMNAISNHILRWLQQNMQLAHLDAVKTLVTESDLDSAAGHPQFICLGRGLVEDEYNKL
jgi:hypothetical protein